MTQTALINGISADTISISDRGLQYGDGLFETIAVIDGQPLCWEEHLNRIEAGCQRLGLAFPGRQILTDEALTLTAETDRAVLKLTLTRGSAGRGYRPMPDAVTTRILGLHAWPDYPASHRDNGVHVRLCTTRLGVNPLLAGMKHLNRLEQVLARSEWDDPAIAEGLMLDQEGHVIAGTMSNLFLYRQGTLLTPDVSQAGITGIIRGRVLALAADMAIDAMIATLDLHDVETADELFLCNSLIGIWPITAVGDKTFTAGPLTQSLRKQLIAHGCISPD